MPSPPVPPLGPPAAGPPVFPGRLRRRLRSVRRAVLARRRLLAAGLTAVAVAAALQATAAPPPATVAVTVAARDLPAGAALSADDLTTARFAPGTEPDRPADDPVGRTLAAPLRRGEPVTDVRLVGAALGDGYPGLSALPVRLADPAVVRLLRVGDRVDLVATDPQRDPALDTATAVLAEDVPVLAVPQVPADGGTDGLTGRLVVLGVPPAEVPAVAGAAVRAFLTVSLNG